MNIYVIFVLGFLLSVVAEKRNNIIYVFFLITLFGLFVGLRGNTIGDDTETYYSMFLYLNNGTISQNYEYGFSLLTYIVLKLFGGDAQAPFVVYSVVTNLLIISRLWTLREKYSFPIAVTLYMFFYYPSTCNIVRQFLAISIVMWGMKYLDKNQIIKYSICVLLATSIHVSAIVSFIFIILYMKERLIRTSRDNRNFLMLVAMIPALFYAAYYLVKNYAFYFSTNNNDFGLFNVIRILFVGCTFFLSSDLFKKNANMEVVLVKGNVGWIKKISNEATNTYRDYAYNRIILFAYILAIALYFLGYTRTTIMRIGMFFGMFEFLYIALVCTRGNGRRIARVLYGALVAFYVIVNSISGWSDLGDYYTYFAQQ